MTTKLLRRECCVVCGADDLAPIVAIPSFPCFRGASTSMGTRTSAHRWRWVRANAADPPKSSTFRRSNASIRLATRPDSAPLGHGTMRPLRLSSTHMSRGLSSTSAEGRDPGCSVPPRRRKRAWTILEPHALKNADLPTDVDVVDGFLEGALFNGVGASVVLCHMFEHVVDLRAALSRNHRQACPPTEQYCSRGRSLKPGLERARGSAQFRTRNLRHPGATESNVRGVRLAESVEQHCGENDTIFLAFVRGIVTPRVRNTSPFAAASPAMARYFSVFRGMPTAVTGALDTTAARHS